MQLETGLAGKALADKGVCQLSISTKLYIGRTSSGVKPTRNYRSHGGQQALKMRVNM
jgi:hypothetical protein